MRTTRFAFAATVAALGLAAAACSSKDSTGPAIALSQEEVFGLAGELSNALSPASMPSTNGPISINVDCPLGGTVSVSGSSAMASQTEVSAGVTFGLQGCKTPKFTTSGSLRMTGTVTSTGTSGSVQVAATGTLSVTTLDGRSGSCPVDVGASSTFTQQATLLTVTVTGSVCGVSVAGTYSY